MSKKNALMQERITPLLGHMLRTICDSNIVMRAYVHELAHMAYARYYMANNRHARKYVKKIDPYPPSAHFDPFRQVPSSSLFSCKTASVSLPHACARHL
jgi:hypothetical protein